MSSFKKDPAKAAMDVNLRKGPFESTDKVGEQHMDGSDRLLVRQQAMTIPGVENVYAAGQMAKILLKIAMGAGRINSKL